MATVTAFNQFFEDMAEGVHDFATHAFKLALTNTAPSTSANTQFSDITELAAGNGYSAGGATATVSSSGLSGAIQQIIFATTKITASGGSVGPFRYLVLYNDTSTDDKLVLVIDCAVELTLADGENVSWLTNTSGNIRVKAG